MPQKPHDIVLFLVFNHYILCLLRFLQQNYRLNVRRVLKPDALGRDSALGVSLFISNSLNLVSFHFVWRSIFSKHLWLTRFLQQNYCFNVRRVLKPDALGRDSALGVSLFISNSLNLVSFHFVWRSIFSKHLWLTRFLQQNYCFNVRRVLKPDALGRDFALGVSLFCHSNFGFFIFIFILRNVLSKNLRYTSRRFFQNICLK